MLETDERVIFLIEIHESSHGLLMIYSKYIGEMFDYATVEDGSVGYLKGNLWLL